MVAEPTAAEFARFQELLSTLLGMQFAEEKRSVFFHRCQKLVARLGLQNFSEYYNHVVNDPTKASLRDLVETVTTRHTYFYREHVQFEFLQDRVLKAGARPEGGTWKIWCAGCSSGEEPFTLAALLRHCLGPGGAFRILATDISDTALRKANEGIYSLENVNRLPPVLRAGNFDPVGTDQARVSESLRRHVTFRALNLNRRQFPLQGGFHAIFCRNVMIYLSEDVRTDLMARFCDLLLPGGHVFLGLTEAVSHDGAAFSLVGPATYRKHGGTAG